MEGRTAVRPSGITPDFHAAFKQTWYKWGVGFQRGPLLSHRCQAFSRVIRERASLKAS